MSAVGSGLGRERLLDFFAAASLANLCLLLVWRELLFASPADRYWMIDFSARHYLAALFNLAWIAAALYAGARAFRRCRHWAARSALIAALLLTLLAPLNYARLALKFDERELFALAENWLYLLGVAMAGAAFAWFVITHFRSCLAALRFVLVLLSPFAVLNVAQAAWAAATLGGGPAGAAVAGRTVEAAPAPVPQRVVWLVFDELDWRLGFEERPRSVHMPEFARLADMSLVAAAREASSATMLAIPSLTIGRTVKKARRIDDRNVALTFADADADTLWHDSDNVFARVRQLGGRTEIVGFYHPYCRIFAGEYDRCAAFPLDVAHMDSAETFAETVLGQLARLTPFNRRISAIWMYLKIASRGSRAAANPSNDFVYLHVSVPHGPNIWNARANRFTLLNVKRDGYFDNLELADRFLGEVRRSLEDAGMWDSTAIVVTADHGWRHVDLIGGKRDRRVPLLVKFAGQHASYDLGAEVDATATKRIVLALLTGELTRPAELEAKLASDWRGLVAARKSP